MNDSQVNALRVRNQERRAGVDNGADLVGRAAREACADIDKLLIALDQVTLRARLENDENARLRAELATAKGEVTTLKTRLKDEEKAHRSDNVVSEFRRKKMNRAIAVLRCYNFEGKHRDEVMSIVLPDGIE